MKYLIKWNIGHGESTEVVDAESESEANKIAYECWREEAEDQADYSAEPLTKENAENYGHENDLDDSEGES